MCLQMGKKSVKSLSANDHLCDDELFCYKSCSAGIIYVGQHF